MIGERLEESRKSKSISIREAADATKIRGEYLAAMEDNSFEINLPEIYIRGFLKNYACFLQLDPEKIMTDYDAQQLGKFPAPEPTEDDSKPQRSSFGRVELKPQGTPSDTNKPVNFENQPESDKKSTPPPPTLEKEGTSRNPENWADNKMLYLKIGVVFTGVLLLAAILVILIQLITRDSDVPTINPEIAQTTESASNVSSNPTNTGKNSNQTTTRSESDSITISASDSVTIIVEQTIDRKRLYSGTINTGESIAVDKTGPVSIRFTNGSALLVEKNGKEFRPTESGVGRTVIE